MGDRVIWGDTYEFACACTHAIYLCRCAVLHTFAAKKFPYLFHKFLNMKIFVLIFAILCFGFLLCGEAQVTEAQLAAQQEEIMELLNNLKTIEDRVENLNKILEERFNGFEKKILVRQRFSKVKMEKLVFEKHMAFLLEQLPSMKKQKSILEQLQVESKILKISIDSEIDRCFTERVEILRKLAASAGIDLQAILLEKVESLLKLNSNLQDLVIAGNKSVELLFAEDAVLEFNKVILNFIDLNSDKFNTEYQAHLKSIDNNSQILRMGIRSKIFPYIALIEVLLDRVSTYISWWEQRYTYFNNYFDSN